MTIVMPLQKPGEKEMKFFWTGPFNLQNKNTPLETIMEMLSSLEGPFHIWETTTGYGHTNTFKAPEGTGFETIDTLFYNLATNLRKEPSTKDKTVSAKKLFDEVAPS
jgi:hypothetical protein